ncbi:MAG: hypothetical protein WC319_02055 [Candidatus Paceibacterota bacterium]|jgi:hypothetical protein
MEEKTNQKSKSSLEKLAPIILIIGVVMLGYFGFSKMKIAPTTTTNTQSVTTQTTPVEVDTSFLMDPKFTSLKFIPDSPIFDEPKDEVKGGRENPFAPVK